MRKYIEMSCITPFVIVVLVLVQVTICIVILSMPDSRSRLQRYSGPLDVPDMQREQLISIHVDNVQQLDRISDVLEIKYASSRHANLAFSPSGELLITDHVQDFAGGTLYHNYEYVVVWNLARNETRRVEYIQYQWNSISTYDTHFAGFTSDRQYMVFRTHNGNFTQAYEVFNATGAFESKLSEVEFEQWLASTGNELIPIDTIDQHVSPDGLLRVSVEFGATLAFTLASSGEVIHSIDMVDSAGVDDTVEVRIIAVAFSPDGRYLAVQTSRKPEGDLLATGHLELWGIPNELGD